MPKSENRRALLEREPHVVVVCLRNFARDALQLLDDLSVRSFRQHAIYDQHELVGAIQPRAKEFVMRLLVEEPLDGSVRQPRKCA